MMVIFVFLFFVYNFKCYNLVFVENVFFRKSSEGGVGVGFGGGDELFIFL